ncbi:uncharacterized protein RJT21DRAFT_58752 [Scheffersomyces amazonensis]|uniref:uncharacterized protein n=1 Tax=Scheffersomyces amazonensis TaxID=1078765 RepID=UPI00315C72D8
MSTTSSISDSSSTPNGPPVKKSKVTKVKSEDTKSKQARLKYSRPCDACSLRKVKCDLKTPACSRCIEHDLPCTNNRVRKKCGPKKIHVKTRNNILQLASTITTSTIPNSNIDSDNSNLDSDNNNNNLDSHTRLLNDTLIPIRTKEYYEPQLSIHDLLPCLQVYQTWYYGVWPVVSVAYLMSKLVNNSTSQTKFFKDSTDKEAISAYSLSCAVSATIIRQVFFLSSKSQLINLPNHIDHEQCAKEAIRSRDFYDYRLDPSPDTLLTSFFLYTYFINIKGATKAAISYLREAISTAQILGLQNPNTYLNKSPAEIHRLRKIYFLLLVTERFICIEDHVPVILEPSIPFPSLNDEEYSTLLTGFTELVKIFAIPDKNFFDKFLLLQINDNNLNNTNIPSKTWIINIHHQLNSIPILQETLDIQKLNLLISKYWMQALTWNICKKYDLLTDSNYDHNSLSIIFPFEIAKKFLNDTERLPLFSFESNGPGVCIKLLEIANSLVDAISLSKNYEGFQYLSQVFALMSTLKNDITLPIHLYNKIESILISHSLKMSNIGQFNHPPILNSQPGIKIPEDTYIFELPDDYITTDELPISSHNKPLRTNTNSPFSTNFNLTFSVPSQTNLYDMANSSPKPIGIFDLMSPQSQVTMKTSPFGMDSAGTVYPK